MKHAIIVSMTAGVVGASALAAQSPLPSQMPAGALYALDRVPVTKRDQESRTLQKTTSPLDRTVNIAFEQIPLADAVAEIAENAMVKLVVRRSVLGDKRVTVQADGIPARQAFALVLSGTSLAVVAAPNGQFTIVDRDKSVKEDGVLVGKVINGKTKRPIAGATITIVGSTESVVTSDDGTFRIPVAVGQHTIGVRALGFVRSQRQVTVAAEENTDIEIVLEPSASVLDEVVVTGTVVATERKAISTPITVITAADIEKRGITRVEELLRGEVPGVIAVDPGMGRYSGNNINGGRDQLGNMEKTDVYVRGNASVSSTNGTPNPLKTFVDGVELFDPGYLGTLDPSSIERIEIITGPQAATIYGSGAMGGVMQIFTKKGNASQSTDITLALKYGILQNSFSNGLTPTHNHGLTLQGGHGPVLTYTGTLTYRYSGQWQPKLYARTYAGSIGATHSAGPLNVTGSFSMTNGANGTSSGWFCTSCTPLYADMVRRGEFSQVNLTGYIGERVSRSSSLNASFNATYALRDWWQNTLTLGRSQNDFALDPTSPGLRRPSDTLYQTSSSSGKRTTASYNTTITSTPLGVLSSSLTIGANGSWGNQVTSSGCLASKVSPTYIEGCRNDLGVSRSVNASSWGGFTSFRAGFWDQLFFTFGLRGESNPNYGRQHRIDWTPTTGLAYTLETGNLAVKFLASYGRATKPPSPDMRNEQWSTLNGRLNAENINWYLYRLAAPNLRPEYSRGPQGGLEVYYGNRLTLTVNRYVQNVTDLIQNVVVDSFPVTWLEDPWIYTEYGVNQRQYLNVASIRQHGLEGTGSLNLGPLNARGTWSWSDSRVTASRLTTYYPGRSFTNIPTHTGSMSISYAHNQTSLIVTTNFMGSMVRFVSSGYQADYVPSSWRLKMYVDRQGTTRGAMSFPSYSITDIAANHRLNAQTTLTLNISNAGNNFTSDIGRALPKLGRTTTMGISLRLR